MIVRVPASSANLGPGFDALGLALSIYLECRFRPADRLSIRVSGRDAAEIPTSEDNLVWQTALAVARDLGESLPPVDLEIRNDIPLGKGLGSSAAALTAGVVIPTTCWGWAGSPCASSTRRRALKATRTTWRRACWARSSPAPSTPTARRARCVSTCPPR
jgi:homoserine kinase